MIAKDEDTDRPPILGTQEAEYFFKDIQLVELFYPTRVENKSIPLKNLDINSENPDADRDRC